MPETLTLRFEGLLVEVRSDGPDDQDWLAEFLLPAFSRVEAGARARVRRRVDLVVDAEGLAALTTRTMDAPADAVAFVLDSGPLRLPAARSGAGLELLDEALAVGYVRRPDGSVTILEAGDSPARARSARVALMRIVREWGQEYSLRSGCLVFHAAAVEHQGRAILVSGPKRAGKTSLVAALLTRIPGLRLLANDRVGVSGVGVDPRCWGLPSIVSVRPGTLDYLPELVPRLAVSTTGYARRSGEPGPARTLSEGRIGLSPGQWAEVLGVELTAAAKPVAILFPRAEAGRARTAVRRLEPAENAGRVVAALFAAGSIGAASELCALPEVGTHPAIAAHQAAAGEFLQTLAGFEVLLGADAYQGDRLAELLAAARD